MAKTIIRPRKELRIIKAKEKKIASLNLERTPIYDKSVPKSAVDAFFEKLEKGTFREFFEKRSNDPRRNKREEEWISKGEISKYKERIVFPVTKSVLGTIRMFDEKRLKNYLKLASSFYKEVKEHNNNFENFEIQPINILGIKKLKTGEYALLEKVFPSTSVFLFETSNRYTKTAIEFLKNKNIDIHKPQFYITTLNNAYQEYKNVFQKTGIDTYKGNILILDYNPKTKKFVFGPIDFLKYSESESGTNYSASSKN